MCKGLIQSNIVKMKHYIIKEFWIGEFPETNWVSVRMSFHFPLRLPAYVELHAGEALGAGVFGQCDCSVAPLTAQKHQET